MRGSVGVRSDGEFHSVTAGVVEVEDEAEGSCYLSTTNSVDFGLLSRNLSSRQRKVRGIHADMGESSIMIYTVAAAIWHIASRNAINRFASEVQPLLTLLPPTASPPRHLQSLCLMVIGPQFGWQAAVK